jgi:single-strand DNA-binding protein
MYINKAFIYGNLTRDPQLRSLPSGVQVAEIGVATNRTWKNKEGIKQDSVEFHNVVAFGRPAELISQYLRKGQPIFVEGRIQTRSWDAQDGSKKYRTEIVVDNFQFGPKGMGGSSSAAGSGSYEKSQGAPEVKKEESAESEPVIDYPQEEINAEDIPF